MFGACGHTARLHPAVVDHVGGSPGARPGGGAPDAAHTPRLPHVPREVFARIATADALFVCDDGDGALAHPEIRVALHQRALRVPLVWRPRRGGARPVPGTRLVVLTADTALRIAGAPRAPVSAGGAAPSDSRQRVSGAGTELLRQWGCLTIAILLAPGRAVFLSRDGEREIVAETGAREPLGTGADGDADAADRFAATALHRLLAGDDSGSAVRAAVGTDHGLAPR